MDQVADDIRTLVREYIGQSSFSIDMADDNDGDVSFDFYAFKVEEITVRLIEPGEYEIGGNIRFLIWQFEAPFSFALSVTQPIGTITDDRARLMKDYIRYLARQFIKATPEIRRTKQLAHDAWRNAS